MDDWFLDDINACCSENFGGCVACEVTENKGRILNAKRAFAEGELILEETPLHVVAEEKANKAFQKVQSICAEQPSQYYEPLWYWAALCSLTQKDLKRKPRVGSLKPVENACQRRLLSLYHAPVTKASDEVEKIVSELGLGVKPIIVEELLQVWILNCFEHTEDPIGYSAYFVSSFCSHSCYPNASWRVGEDDTHVLRARRPISIGDEICITYLDEDALLDCADVRRAYLKETKLFDCTCERCAPRQLNEDPCRGFRCEACRKCAVFHRLKNKKGQGLRGVLCKNCGVAVTAERAAKLMAAEESLRSWLADVDNQLTHCSDIAEVTTSEEIERYLNMFEDENEVLGPQHWLCNKLWGHAIDWANSEGDWKRVARMERLRREYKAKAYCVPGQRNTKSHRAKYKWVVKNNPTTAE